jgi:O-antigen ligase
MSNKIQLTLKNININYFNILYALIMPSFVLGQFYFKLVFIIIIISGIIRFKLKIFNFSKNYVNLFFIITLIYFSLNVLFVSGLYYVISLRFIFFILLLIFYFVTNFLLLNNYIHWNKIFSFNIIIFLFIYFDTLIQIIFLKDLFGYTHYEGYGRFSGPFGDEFILGAFMSYYLIATILIYFKSINKNKFTTLLVFLFFIMSIYIAIKTGERIAFLTIILQIFLIPIIFQKINKAKFIILSLISIMIVGLFIVTDEKVKKKYEHFYLLVLDYNSEYIDKDKNKTNINSIGFLNTQTGAHFLTGIEIWKNYPILGVGIKNFRKESSKEKYSKIISHQAKFRNATHPHNYQIELLSETGIVGFALFNILFLLIFFNIFKQKFTNKKNDYFLDIFLIVIISKYFPFKSDASLFSSSMGLLFWMFVIFLLSSYNKLLISYNKVD